MPVDAHPTSGMANKVVKEYEFLIRVLCYGTLPKITVENAYRKGTWELFHF